MSGEALYLIVSGSQFSTRVQEESALYLLIPQIKDPNQKNLAVLQTIEWKKSMSFLMAVGLVTAISRRSCPLQMGFKSTNSTESMMI